MKKILATLFLLLATPALAQQAVQQSGFVTPGHVPAWVTNGVIGDAGSAQSPSLTSIGTVGQGNTICANSGPQTGPYNQLCLGANLNSAAQIVLQNFGGATPQSLQVVVNGTTFTVPFGGGGSGSPCTTTSLSLQYNAFGSLGCVSEWTSDGTNLIPVLGSDATGDIYYRNASGFLTRLGIGTTNQVLTVSAGLPSWQTASSGAVSSVSNSDGTLTISPTTGAVVASLALAHGNAYSGNNSYSGTSTWTGSLITQVRSSAASTVTASATTDYFFCLDPTSNAITLNLPATPATGLTYLVKDCTGKAATHSITITPNSGNVDGSATFVMSTNFQSVGVTYTGSQWSIN